jgi:hypothetical protein
MKGSDCDMFQAPYQHLPGETEENYKKLIKGSQNPS